MNTAYLTDEELLRAPTGIDWSSIPRKGASTEEQFAERKQLILDASAFVDTECGQKLYATQDTEIIPIPSRRASFRNGLYVFTKFSPLVSITSLEFSADGVDWTAITGTPVIAGRTSFTVPSPITGSRSIAMERFLRVTYMNGYPNTFLTAVVNNGDESIIVDSALGIRPGYPLTFYDVPSTEEAWVNLAYIPGDLTVALSAPLITAHPIGTVTSGIPPEIRIATRLVVMHYVRLRGRDTIAVSSSGGARTVRTGNVVEALEEAKDRIKAFRRLI